MWATAPIVMTIIVINVAVWLLQTILPETRGPYDFITFSFGALPIAIANGEWYRLITPMFLHAPDGIWHIGLNSYALFIFGPNVEQAFGKVKFIAIYLVAGLTGSVLSYALGPCNQLGVGASGAIFGVIGALFVFLYNRRHQTFVRGYLKNIIFLIGLNLVIGYALPGIDNLAHLGGLAGGALMAVGLDQPPGRMAGGVRWLAFVAVAVLAIGLLVMRTATFTCG
jgi:rhomboid protease GluP